MSNRHTFRFEFGHHDIREAADRKREYHLDRLNFWQEQRDVAEADLRATGVEFREHQVTNGKQIDVVLDPEKQAWLNTCTSKIQTHQNAHDEYERWHHAMSLISSQVTTTFELDVDDVAYFGL